MKLFGLFLTVLISVQSINAQIFKPVKWTWDSKQVGNNEYELIFKAKIDDGWALYSQYLDEDGPVPTSFTYESPKDVELVGKNQESGPKKKEGYDELFGMNLIKYYKSGTFVQKIKVKDASQPIEGYLTFMTCDEERCLPPEDIDFSITLKQGKTASKPVDQGASTPTKKEVEEVKAKTETKVAETKAATPPKSIPIPKTHTAQPSTTTAIEAKVEDTKTKIQEAKTTISETAQSNTKRTESHSSSIKKEEPQKVIAQAKEKTLTKKQEAKKEIEDTKSINSIASNEAHSGIFDPVTWTFDHKKVGEGEYELTFKAKMEEGYYIYSQFLESDEGPSATSFNYEAKENIKPYGKIVENGKKKTEFDKIFDMNVTKVIGNSSFVQKAKIIDNDKTAHLKGYIDYQVCNASRCIPKEQEFSFTVGGNKADVAVVPITGNIKGDKIDQLIPSLKASHEEPVGDCGQGAVVKSESWWGTFFFGFVGGLLALLTPCVFPMIPLTVSFFTKDTKRKGWVNGLLYGLSIMVIYVGLGLLITTVFGATALNELSTNWIANTIFFVIFVFFAFSFFGFYEITLPSSWTTKSDQMADKGGLIGLFFLAATLALVSFSCTGPIIGTALVESASGGFMGPLVVMLGFSLALAIPFGLFAAFPTWLNTLPKSGGWMNSVKVVLGFIELALAFKFLSVADMTSHWGVLGYEIFMGIWILIAAAMTLYLFGFIKFPHDSPIKKLSVPRFIFGLGSLVLTIALCTGFFINPKTNAYNSLSMLSGIAPPVSYNYFLEKPEVPKDLKTTYPSFSKCANNLDCFKDYYEGLDYAKKINKPILVDFTGHGCVNCRRMEEHVWIEDEVHTRLDKEFVLISLYVDDREKLDKVLYSERSNKKLRSVGHKWSDFQIVNFNQNSQPLYVMVSPTEEVLASPIGYDQGKIVEDYVDYLDCGLSTFKQKYSSLGQR